MTSPEKCGASNEPNSLISSHPSTSGLQISLHPLALLTISDYITRHTLRNGTGPIIGALMGTQQGREIDIEHAYETLLLVDKASVDESWFAEKLKLFKETHPALDLLGWFTTTSSSTFAPSPWMVPLHRQLLNYNESLILLCLNPSPSASIGGGGKLPLAIYESIFEADDSATTADAPTQESKNALKLLFVPLNYTIETGEAEMIGVDFVAKGGFGNAAAEFSGLEGTATEASAKEGAKKIKLGEDERDSKGKGKDKADDKEGDAPIITGTQNDELLANLTAKANAIRMLHSRIKLLTTYLSEPPHEQPNHQLLRSLKSLTHSRLPLLTPADAKGFRQEQLAEQSDVHLVALLGTLTKSIEEVRGVGKKFWGIEQTGKANAAGRGSGGGGSDLGDWGESGRRGFRRSHGGLGGFTTGY